MGLSAGLGVQGAVCFSVALCLSLCLFSLSYRNKILFLKKEYQSTNENFIKVDSEEEENWGRAPALRKLPAPTEAGAAGVNQSWD